MNNGYQVTIKIANSFVSSGPKDLFIPHAFVTISGPDLSSKL